MLLPLCLLFLATTLIHTTTYLIFAPRHDTRKSKPLKSPFHRGTNISHYGLHPRRISTIQAQHTTNDSDKVYQASIKAKETLPSNFQLTGWQRYLYYLNIRTPTQGILTGIFIILSSAIISIIVALPFYYRFSSDIFILIFTLLWVVLWALELYVIRSLAILGIALIEETLPFSFNYIWAIVRAQGDLGAGIKTAYRVVGDDCRTIPLLPLIATLYEKTRAGNTLSEVFEISPEVRIFPDVYHFISSLNFYGQGVGVSNRIQDLNKHYRDKRKIKQNKWQPTNILFTIAYQLNTKGFDWFIPIGFILTLPFFVAIFTAIIPLLVFPITVLIILTLAIIRYVLQLSNKHDEKELTAILRPFYSRLTQGAHPQQALRDVQSFLHYDSNLKFQADIILACKGDKKELASVIREQAKNSSSQKVERFWLTFALTTISQIEISDLIEELVI